MDNAALLSPRAKDSTKHCIAERNTKATTLEAADESGYALAVDIEGTFTDIVLRAAFGQAWVDQMLTAPEDIRFFRVRQDRHQARRCHRRDHTRHGRAYHAVIAGLFYNS
jgi:hypothetical protein